MYCAPVKRYDFYEAFGVLALNPDCTTPPDTFVDKGKNDVLLYSTTKRFLIEHQINLHALVESDAPTNR